MSTPDGLSPPGSSTYDGSTMYVGDGTWDASRNSFLLPNLQGLNFETMQYNGMGNRFRDLPQYHVLITGHAVIAAIVFLGVMPAAIFIARFYHSEGRLAYKLHVYLQIINVFLVTVVFALGNFAVGPRRALSNPHHGIGLAIYVCILVQFLYGWWWSRRERKRTRPHPTIPLKVHIHRLFGRAIAVLGFVQIALGLTLYGSPKVLFILYALWGAFLLFWYFTLEYRNKPRIGPGAPPPRSDYYSDYTGSYITGDQTELTQDGRRRDGDKHHWGRNILAGAGVIGAYEWFKHRRQSRSNEKDDRYEARDRRQHPPGTPGPPASSLGPPSPAMPGPGYAPSGPGYAPPPAGYAGERPSSRGGHRSQRHGGSVASPQSWENDDYDDPKDDGRQPRRSGNWHDRILGAGAGIAAFEGVKNLFGRKRRRSEGYMDSQISYGQPTQTDVSRVEAGQAPYSPNDPRNNSGRRAHFPDAPPMTPTRPPPRRRPSLDSTSYDDDQSYAPRPRPSAGADPTLRESITALGAVAGLREWNRRRRDRRERNKLDAVRQQELDNEEEYNRRNSNRYPNSQHARRQSTFGTVMTGPTGPDPALGSNPELSRTNFQPDTMHPPLPAAAGTIPSASLPPSSIDPRANHQQPPVNGGGSQYQEQYQIPYNLPPPPPGPPPNAVMNTSSQQPLQMPPGAVEPDPSRLVQQQGQFTSELDGGGAIATVGTGAVASGQRTQIQSPSRRQGSRTRRPEQRGSSVAASSSQVNDGGIASTGSPPVSVKVNMHPDGRHVTLRRLNEDEAAAERAARRRERRSRRASSLSSGGEDTGRYRRTSGIRRSSDQPITNVPPPPAMSSSAGGSRRPPSELNLPPVPVPGSQIGRTSQAPDSPQSPPAGLLPAVGPSGSGQVGSPGNVPGTGTDMGTGTDVSAFDNNRKRRRAERQRRLEASRGGNNHHVEFS